LQNLPNSDNMKHMSEIPKNTLNSQSSNPYLKSDWLIGVFAKKTWDIMDILPIADMRQALIPYKCSEEWKRIIHWLSDESISILNQLKKDGLSIISEDIHAFSDKIIGNLRIFINSESYALALHLTHNWIFGRSFWFIEFVELSTLNKEDITKCSELNGIIWNQIHFQEWKIISGWSNQKYDIYKGLYTNRHYTPWDYFDANENQISIQFYENAVTEEELTILVSLNQNDAIRLIHTILEIERIFPDFKYTWWNNAKILEDFYDKLWKKYIKNDSYITKSLSPHLQEPFLLDQPNWDIKQNSSNCYFVAALWSLMKNPKYRMILEKSMVQLDKDTWKYTFPDGNEITVTQEEINDYENSSHKDWLIIWPIGYKILEIAHIKYLDHWRKCQWGLEKWFNGTQWWNVMEVLRIFLWNSHDYFKIKTNSIPSMVLGQFGLETIWKWISNIVAHISGSWEYFYYKWIKMANKHAYSIIDYNSETKTISLINPWNTSKVLQFEYKEFLGIFDEMSIIFTPENITQ
jgi:hypothetical protein